ncbi:glycosyltransferase [bacterium]
MIRIGDYKHIVGESIIDELHLLSDKMKGRKMLNINSTAIGGGVAELLNHIVPLLADIGVNVEWEVIKGGIAFFEVTKKFHNLLHGRPEEISDADFEIFLETNRKNAEEMELKGDVIIVHDPQPVALIKKRKSNKWIWRCHIDLSNPETKVWEFLKKYIIKYDAAVFSSPSFAQNLPIRQFMITPSIDPLSDKNRDLTPEQIDSVIKKYGINKDKPILTQISRFDRLKDPLGVIQAYKLVKRYIDCQLILAGGTAADDPEGMMVLEDVKDRASNDKDIHVILLPHNDIEVNALQRASTIILQKSLKEGFGLTVTEALWKGKPVVASHVGGIALQVKHKYSGMLCYSPEGAAFAIKQILNSPEYARKLGENGKEHVKNNFLITRHIRDYLLLCLGIYNKEGIVHL